MAADRHIIPSIIDLISRHIDDIHHMVFVEEKVGDDDYIFYLKTDSGISVGNIEISKLDDETVELSSAGRHMRRSTLDRAPVIKITSIVVEEDYKGQGFGKLILIYGLCVISQKYDNIIYAKLDDISDKRDDMLNLYSILGFTYMCYRREGEWGGAHSSIISRRKIAVPDIEKIACFNDPDYFKVLHEQTIHIINRGKKRKRGGGLSRKARKTKARKVRKARKARKTRKPRKRKQ